jgi:hypothetical protein
MIELKRIFPECSSDTLLVELVLQRGKPMHLHGISSVAKHLVEYTEGDHFITGLVDTDKFKRDKDNPNIQKFSEVVLDKVKDEGLLILRYPTSNKYLIRIHPEFESWFWKTASECGISSNEYGFHSFDSFFMTSKRNNASEDKNFKKFVNAVVLKNPAPIQTLRAWLSKVF